jgi:hypothetical protein
VLDVGNVTEGTFGGTDVSSVSLETEFDGIEMPALSSGARALPPAEGEPTLKAHTAGRPETTGRLLQVVAGARSDRLHTARKSLAIRIRFIGK